MSQYSAKRKCVLLFFVSVWCKFVFICLPERPLEGRGSLSDWMGSAGDLSREAASACSHAQLSAHRMTWSARGASIPKTSLWPFHPSLPKTMRGREKTHRPGLLHPSFSALRNLKSPFFFFSVCLSSPRNYELSKNAKGEKKMIRVFSVRAGVALLSQPWPLCFIEPLALTA